jgi:glyoxylase-like metal-dependent hydrolase (beta-lactamase superfamily II)
MPRSSNPSQALLRHSPIPSLPNLHQIILPTPWNVETVRIYLIEGSPLTLIDTGVKTEDSFAALTAAFDQLGHGLDEVERIILTHYHEDHLGQAQVIRDAGADLEVWAHADEAEIIEGWSPEAHANADETADLFAEYGVPEEYCERFRARLHEHARATPISGATRVDRTLGHGDTIAFKDFELGVIHSPGHTAGHILLHEKASATLVTGDHIMGCAVPFTENFYISEVPDPSDPLARRPRFRGLERYVASIRELQTMPLSTILPAHGGVIDQARRYLDDARLFYDVRVQRIERGLRSLAAMGQEVTAWEVWRALFPKADPVDELNNRMLMVIGALDILEHSGACTTSRRPDGVLVHTHSPRA